MRKLAPMVLIASITALIGGPALAATGATNSTSPDKVTGSPSVQANTNNPAGLSYSDKSNTSPGTNARMDEQSPVTTGQMPDAHVHDGISMDERDKMTTEKKRKHKAKMAKSDMTKHSPVDSTSAAAANSITGKSPGS